MFPYTVKYTESEHDIQHNDLLYKTHQPCQNTFEVLGQIAKFHPKTKKNTFNFMICISSIINIL